MKVLYFSMAIFTILAASGFAVYKVKQTTQLDLPPVQPRSSQDKPMPIANDINPQLLVNEKNTRNSSQTLPNFAPIPPISQAVQPHTHVHNTNTGPLVIPEQLAHSINKQLTNNLTINDLPGKRFTNGQVVIATQGRLKSVSAVSLNEQGELVFHEHREPIAVTSTP